MKNKTWTILIVILLLGVLMPLHIVESRPWRKNPAKALMGFDSTIYPIHTFGTASEGTFTPGLGGYRFLVPVNLVSEKGLLITQSDDLQYSRGSKTQNNESIVYENFDPHQGTLEFWIRPNFASTDTNDHYIFDIDTVNLFWDGSETKWTATINGVSITSSDSFSAGIWIYILVTWDEDAPTLDMTVDSTTESQVTSAQTIGTIDSNIFIGQDQSNANIFNGTIAGRVTNKIESSNYNSGDGLTDTFTVTSDTAWLGTYSDDDTDAVFQHRGQAGDVLTTTVVDLAGSEIVGNRSWADDDRVVIYDGTGYKKETQINDASIESTDTTITVDVTTDLDKVGVYPDLDGDGQCFYKTDDANLSITADMTISAWVKTLKVGNQGVIEKWTASGNKKSYALLILSAGYLQFHISDDGTGNEAISSTDTIYVSDLAKDDKWHHVALVYDNTADTVDFYIDGYADSGGTQTFTSETGTLNDNDSEFCIGANKAGGYEYFDGGIRDVAIWNNSKATAAEILSMAINPLTEGIAATNAPTAWWPLTDADTSATISDDSTAGNSLDLTPYDGGNVTYTFANIGRTQKAFISKQLVQDAGMENGGIGEWAQGDAASTIAKNSSIVKFDGQSFKITNADASQAFIRQTITTVAGEDYVFNGWMYGPTTVNGASQLVDADATAALGVTATQAGISAGAWKEINFGFEAADTATTIDLGTGSVIDTQIGYWDNIQFLPNLVDNGGCEASDSALAITNNETAGSDVVIEMADTGDLAVGDLVYFDGTGGGTTEWTTVEAVTLDTSITVDLTTNKSATDEVSGYTWDAESTPVTGEVVFSAASDHSGALGVELVNADDGEGVTQDITVVSGKYYTFSFWEKNNSQDIDATLSGATTKTIDATGDNSWTKHSFTFLTVTTTLTVNLISGATDQDGYFDDIACIRLDHVSPTTSTPSSLANSYGTGKYSDADGALFIDGGDTLTYPNASNMDSKDGGFGFWAYINAPYSTKEDLTLLDIRGANDNNRIRIYYEETDDKFKVYINGDDRILSVAQTDNTNFYTWIYIVFIYDFARDKYILYINAIQVGKSTTNLSKPSFGASTIFIGSDYNSVNQGDIIIDDLFIFDAPIKRQDIKRLYLLKRSAHFRELGWW